MIGTSTRLPAIQRLVEIKTIAEHLHFKISTLLLHGGKLIEAVTWFHQHKASYEKVVGSTEFIFLHWEWMSRQFLVFAELLETSSANAQSFSSLNQGTSDISLTEFEFYPAYYYQLAAHFLKEKKSALELLLSMSDTAQETDSSSESITPSVYVGQFAQLLEKGETFTLHSITDEEYTRYTISEAKRFQDSFEIIAWLKRSYESFTKLKARRMAALCAFEVAREYFGLADPTNAKLFFDIAANLYRQEGWVTLLWEVLGYLRECSRNLGNLKDFVELSLEMVALPVTTYDESGNLGNKKHGPGGPATISGRESIHREVFTLVCREGDPISSNGESGFKLATDGPLHLEIDLVSPLRPVLLASVAFHEQMIKPGALCSITLSLLSHLPLPVEIDHLEVQFNQSTCNFVIRNSQRPLWASASDTVQSGSQVENEQSLVLVLVPNNWLRLTYAIKPEQSGKLECLSILVKLGPLFTICSRAESPAAMEDLPVWKHENRVESLPTKDPVLAVFGQKATQVEEPEPQVDVSLGASGPALVGEAFTMPITVTSKGHAVFSGELKINLVDVGGGGLFSPREAEPFSLDSHHVEICGIDGAEGNDESESETGNIKKIQQSFGLVSVPDLKEGESWSCKLEIRWHRPKPVMLFVSLGYLPHGSEANAQKVHIHKSLQIEGKMPLYVSNRFMLPFRRDHLLLSRIKPAPDSEDTSSLPLKEKSVLVVSAKNCTEIALELVSMSIEFDDGQGETSCLIELGGATGSANLAPGEEFKKVFTVIPTMKTPKLGLGSVHLKWRRQGTEACVSTKHKLPEVNVEASPLVMSLKCPPYAILGEPFTYAVRICNQTQLLQEAKFALADAQSFVLSGSHSNTVSVLPKSEHVLSYKLVPLTCGQQQLPKITLTSLRYSAEFQPSAIASSVFVFPSAPQANKTNITAN